MATTHTSASDPERANQHSRLLGIKLAALVRGHLDGDAPGIGGDSIGDPREFGPGAGLMVGKAAWVLLDDDQGPRLGASLAWAIRQHATSLDVVAADQGSGSTIARRAAEFSFPIRVWLAHERDLIPVEAAPPEPAVVVPEHHRVFTTTIIDGGAEPTIEFGVLAGEVRGLEVCRVVDDEAMGVTRLEVGTGAHDREAFAMLHGDTPTPESLKRIADTVAQHRVEGAAPHPLNRLAQERLLRHRAITDPALLADTNIAALRPAEPPVPRPNLRESIPAVAAGEDIDGQPVVVVFAVGIDLELVPFAADARLAINPQAALVICTPRRDQIPLISELNAQLRTPGRMVTVG